MISIVIVCEARADRDTAADLADRVILETIDWIDEDHLEHQREWRGLRRGESHLNWKSVNTLARAKNKGIRFRLGDHGYFNDEPGSPDARTARNALLLLKRTGEIPDAVVFIRDGDRQGDQRRTGLEQARARSRKKLLTCPWSSASPQP